MHGCERVKFKGIVGADIDYLSGIPFSRKLIPKIVHNHTDSSALGKSDTAWTPRLHTCIISHTHTPWRPQSFMHQAFFWLWSLWSSTRVLIEKLMQKNQLASSFASDRLLKASSRQQSMLSTWVALQPPHSFVYGLIAGGFWYMNFNEINSNFSPFAIPYDA